MRVALFELALKLISYGAVVRVALWDKRYKGIDDYLTAHPDKLDAIEEKAKWLTDIVQPEDLDGVVRALARTELPYERREQLVKVLSKRLLLRPETLERAVWRELQERENQNQAPAFSEDVLHSAREFLKSGDIMGSLLGDLEHLYAGRRKEKLLLYLVATCRKVLNLDSNPVLILRGDPAVGKSQLVRTILSLIDEKESLEISHQTPKFLYHVKEDLRHKVVFFSEWSATDKASESIKLSITEKGLAWAGVEKNKRGELVSVYKKVDTLPMPIISTAVNPSLSPEILSRSIVVSLVGDKQLYAEALRVKSLVPTEEKENVKTFWRAVDSLLEKAEVEIPWIENFVNAMAETVEDGRDLRD